jgi:hypothetical protein
MEECAYGVTREGERVTLKAGAFPQIKIRYWMIACHLKNGKILLRNPKRNYTLEVTPGDIEGEK